MSTSGIVYEDANAVYKSVQDYYGRVLQKTSDLKTSACCTAEIPPKFIEDIIYKIPHEITDKYYGCGTPLPAGIEGLRILDLGSGSGRDCYIAAALTGPTGYVTGIDMTPQQIAVARAHVDTYMKTLGYPKPNLRFVDGYIEFLEKAGIEPNSLDLVISNCVVNLSPDKNRVLQEVYKALRNGGEFYFSDVYCSRRLPKEIRSHDILLGECIGGALYVEDFKRICHQVGFTDPRQISSREIKITHPELRNLLGEARFYSITWRCFKIGNLETIGEDYGQLAIYRGNIKGEPNAYQLDDHHRFERGLPVRVCGNTALMVGETWLGKYFEVIGNRSVHYGAFDCTVGAKCEPPAPTSGGSSCCAPEPVANKPKSGCCCK